MDLVVFGLALPWLVVAVGSWIGYQLIRQNGRVLLRLDELEHRLGHLAAASGTPAEVPLVASGLALGSAAPVLSYQTWLARTCRWNSSAGGGSC